MTRRFNFWLAALLLFIGAPIYWFLLDSGTGNAAAKPVSIGQLRTLALSLPGPLPQQLRVETVATGAVMRNLLYAGGGLRSTPVVLRAFQLVVPHAKPITIDAATSRRMAEHFHFDTFDEGARRRVQQATMRAGIALLQASLPLRNGGLPVGSRPPNASTPIASQGGPRVIAPGVVAIPLASLAPDATLIFAHMADGREYLFAAAVARSTDAWRDHRMPARYTTRHESSRFRSEMASWLMTIHALHRHAPKMAIIAGLDPAPIPMAVSGFSN